MQGTTKDTAFEPDTSAIVAIAHARRADAMRDAFASMAQSLRAMSRGALSWLMMGTRQEGAP